MRRGDNLFSLYFFHLLSLLVNAERVETYRAYLRGIRQVRENSLFGQPIRFVASTSVLFSIFI
jgi:hypothetical protein